MNGSHESWSALATLAVLAGSVASCAGGGSATIQITPYSSSSNSLPVCHDSERFACPAGSNVVTLTATEDGYSGAFTASVADSTCLRVQPVAATPNQFYVYSTLRCCCGAPIPPPTMCQSTVTVTDDHGGTVIAYVRSQCV